MTRREFLKTPEQAINRKNINVCAICGYVVAAISLVLNIAVFDNYAAILDTILVIAASLIIHLLQSRIAAIILAVYAIINMVYVTIATGRIGGWWLVLIGAYAVYYTFRFQKDWKEYRLNYPEE